MKNIIFLLFLILTSSLTAQPDFKTKENKIDSLMKSHIVHEGKRPVHNFLLYAKNENTGLEVYKGAGTTGRSNTPVSADYNYPVASITKTFVAVIILQLEEEGKLNITDKAGRYLNDLSFLRFREIHIMNDSIYAGEITVQNLLQHTSGIADIFTDAATRFNISVYLHKKREFTPEKVIERFYKYNLNNKPFNKPGEGYHYSDINYMLLGFIIEKLTGESLPQAIRERILTRLNMKDTWFDYCETAPPGNKRIDAFLNKINMTERINTSYEWGGGGLVGTTKDMAVFIESLFNMQLFKNKSTLDKMLDFSVTKKYGANYGMGIYKYELNGMVFYGHGGFYGSVLAYDPIDKITFSANIGQANPPYDTGKLVDELIKIIATR